MGLSWYEIKDWSELYDKYLRASIFSFALNVRVENDYEYLVWDRNIILKSLYASDKKHEFTSKNHNQSKREKEIPLCDVDRLKSIVCRESSEVLLIRCMNGDWFDSDIVRFRHGPDDMPDGFISRNFFDNFVGETSQNFNLHDINHSNEKLKILLETFITYECSK